MNLKSALPCLLVVLMFTMSTVHVYGADEVTNAETCAGDDTCPLAAFKDTDSTEWYHDGVHACLEQRILSGVSANYFGPSHDMTREEMVLAIYHMDGQGEAAAEDAVAWATEQGILVGYNDVNLGTEDVLLREQLAVLLYRYAAYRSYSTEYRPLSQDFQETSTISTYAESAMIWACQTGICSVTWLLEPQETVTRAEAADAIYAFMCYGTDQEELPTVDAEISAEDASQGRLWMYLFAGSLTVNLGLIVGMTVSFHRRRNRIDDTPLVDYDIDDDML
jgi:hypothetical protein